MAAQIDLHCHSTISDGLLSPEDLVAHAAKSGVKVLALTDHDDVSGLKAAREAAPRHGIQFVNGVEISVTWKRRTLHIVGLKIDSENIALRNALDRVRIGRDERAQEMAAGLAKVGIAGAYEGAKAIANQSILTRSHFAQFLVQNGHVKDVKSVFKKYLVKGKPGFVDHQWMSLEEAVGLIRASGGSAVVAHPGRYDLGTINMLLLMHEFRSYGGAAIEVVTGSHTPPQYQQFAKMAHRFSLKSSIGSDYHGPGLSYMAMGCVPELPVSCVPVWDDWPEAQYLD
ncbi:MAG TPA: 3',5'-nucleoside bisphosphate phosphatase [Methylotenera sp.]|nr:3',5'-nucleoside bisphosphate phosphatase [Methylotenera sp.]HPV44132.1 3',5'-nucleoside bisphosphate phosphatase [Methylotenera sp.]